MLILWTFLISATSAHKVFESTEDIGPEAFANVTTLYPITNKIAHHNTANNDTNTVSHHTNTGNSNITNTITYHNTITDNNDNYQNIGTGKKYNKSESNNNSVKEMNSKNEKPKLGATIWKIEAAFAESDLDKNEEENINTNENKNNATKEFRPSQHLGSFFDEDEFVVTPKKESFEPFLPVKKPASSFVSSSIKDDYSSLKLPKQMLQTHKQYPYKFEDPIITRARDSWRERPDFLEPKPTAEVPIKVPAGGLYKYSDPFKEKPGNYQDEDFGLEFIDNKENAVKKRVNPWDSLVRMITAFIPVGLIISALTPSLITIQDSGPGQQNGHPSNLYRRSDLDFAELPVISERCRRRLLCELHSENNYKHTPSSSSRRRGKQCFKIRCEDTAALARTLQWLLEYRQPGSQTG